MTALVAEKPSNTAALHKAKQSFAVNGAVPPLENGDNLGRAEFERRYQGHPEIKKAELIERTIPRSCTQAWRFPQ